jgi:hypothetical protein
MAATLRGRDQGAEERPLIEDVTEKASLCDSDV